MHQSHYFKQIVSALESNGSITAAVTNPALTELNECFDTTNDRLNIDLNAINGNDLEVGNGNISTGVQRVCIADDDVNLNKISDAITGTDETDRAMRVDIQNESIPITADDPLDVTINNTSIPVTSASTLNVSVQNSSIPVTSASTLNVSIQNASLPVTSASSLGVTIGNASIPVTSASTLGVNVSQLSGSSIQIGSGTATNTLRVNIATNDTVSLNLYKLLSEPRALYGLTSNTYTDTMIGGFSSSIIGTDWIVLPNNSSGSITTADVNCYQNNSTFSIITDASSDYVGFDGAQSLLYSECGAAIGTILVNSVSITSASTTVTPDVSKPEIFDIYTGLDGQNSKNNVNDIYIQNNSGKYMAMIPAGYGKASFYYIQVPSGLTVFLERLRITNNELTNVGRGMRARITVRSVLSSTVSTIAREYTVFSASVPYLQSIEFDLRNLLPIRNINSSNSTHTDYIMLSVKGDNEGGTGTTAGSAFLTAKVYRS